MSLTVVNSGSQTAVISTEHTLNSDTLSGSFVFRVNLVNMAALDVVELRVYTKVLSTDTLAVQYKYTFYNAPDADNTVQQSAVIYSNQATKITLTQTAGTGRVFPWSMLQIPDAGTAAPTAAAVATAVWQDATGGDFIITGSIGKSLFTSGVVPGAAGGLFIAGTNAATTITTGLTAHIIGTVDTLTTYTGNTPQTGDCFARLGAPVGASIAADLAEIEAETDGIASIPTNPLLTTDTRIAHLDADVSSRMATYGQPAGFLAATFPGGTLANTTNITAASGVSLAASQHVVVDSGTVTTLTNLPSIPANWLTAAGIAAGALNGKGDWNATTPPTAAAIVTATWQGLLIGSDFGMAGSIGALLKADIDATISSRIKPADTLARVTLVDTCTANTDMRGTDNAALAATALSTANWTNARAAKLDDLDATISSRSAPATAQTIDLTTAVPTSNTANAVGDCLNAARAQGFGKWVIDLIAKTLTLYADDGSTVVRTFNLDSVTAPTQRV